MIDWVQESKDSVVADWAKHGHVYSARGQIRIAAERDDFHPLMHSLVQTFAIVRQLDPNNPLSKEYPMRKHAVGTMQQRLKLTSTLIDTLIALDRHSDAWEEIKQLAQHLDSALRQSDHSEHMMSGNE